MVPLILGNSHIKGNLGGDPKGDASGTSELLIVTMQEKLFLPS